MQWGVRDFEVFGAWESSMGVEESQTETQEALLEGWGEGRYWPRRRRRGRRGRSRQKKRVAGLGLREVDVEVFGGSEQEMLE